ncbi:MAG: aminotransferase class III-fold pyridoxal phosphate-dependent enzyme, partial [Acidobacteriota bacterium]|nr:aminotransferase class III-fold pyridoxal phosphate-dependent enzyme [Acidobacteriota bacterium]
VRRAEGAIIEDLDGNRLIDYWQGHYGNIFGHNPAVVREALTQTLEDRRGLQTGMLHEIEGEVAEMLCRCTGSETLRLTTSGSLGTFYAVLLARAFTGRDRVLKVAGGWHGSQPFGLRGVSARHGSFDHMESEGLPASTSEEVVLTEFNNVEDLRARFEEMGDRIACFLVEPILGAGGGMASSVEYLREARRLTEHHGALLLCDEIITGVRFRAGDVSTLYGVKPDLLILGKVLGGGMPVAAVAGRRDVLALGTRAVGRVKFEGGTFSAHELSLVATRALVRETLEREHEIYPKLGELGNSLRAGLESLKRTAPLTFHIQDVPPEVAPGSSLAFLHVTREGAACPRSPDQLAESAHPVITERLLKAALLLEDVSVRFGIGSLSTAHTSEHIEKTITAFGVALRKFADAGLA